MKYLVLVLVFFCKCGLADAFCSLRDPVSQINTLFPSHESHLSLVKKIDNQTRQIVQSKLPNNDLHFGELGQHTLYVVAENSKVLGYVHVRSEQSYWGLVEIVWAIDTEYKIIDFVFQRCRSPEKEKVLNSSFKSALIGRNFEQLKLYLDKDGRNANQKLYDQINIRSDLVNVVLRCALKTLLLTEVVWQAELNDLNE